MSETNGRHILIVDDESVIIELLSHSLKKLNFSVSSAENGLKGFEAAKKDQPDLIILDMNMPVMDGAATLTLLKSTNETVDIPVVVFSAYIEDAIRVKELGAFNAVNKSLGYKALIECVSKYFADQAVS